MADGSWVEDFSNFQDSTASAGLTGRKVGAVISPRVPVPRPTHPSSQDNPPPPPHPRTYAQVAAGSKHGVGPSKTQSRSDKIESELKLLEWHKLANDAALKAALMQTKSLREDVPQVKPKHVADDARWIKKVIEEEHLKSLKVSKDYVLEYERKEQDQLERTEAHMEKNLETLAKLKTRLESKVQRNATQRNATHRQQTCIPHFTRVITHSPPHPHPHTPTHPHTHRWS